MFIRSYKRRGGQQRSSSGGRNHTNPQPYAQGRPKKPKPADHDHEEVTSEEEEEEHQDGDSLPSRNSKLGYGIGEEEDQDEHDQLNDETEQETRIRLAKDQIRALRKKLTTSRGDNEDHVDDEEQISAGVLDPLQRKQVSALLKDHVMQEQGKVLRRVVPEAYAQADLAVHVVARGGKVLKSPLTCMCCVVTTTTSTAGGNRTTTSSSLGTVYASTKAGFVVSYDLVTSPASSGAEGQNRGPPARLAQSRKLTPPPVFSICGTARVVAASTSTGIHLLDPATLAVTHVLANSRDGFSLAAGSDHLYSTHRDRTVKVWDLNERAYVESLFGHQDIPTAVDVLVMGGRGPNSSTSKRIVTSGGFDNTLRMWKIDEESQLVYNWADEDVIDVVKVLDGGGGFFVAGGISGNLALFSLGRKKPLHVVSRAHGIADAAATTENGAAGERIHSAEQSRDTQDLSVGRWITAISGCGDLVATGSTDGLVKVWRVVSRKLEFVRDVPVGGDGVIVGICVVAPAPGNRSDDHGMLNLIVAVSTEMRNGRWAGRVGKCNRIVVVCSAANMCDHELQIL